MSRRAGGDSAIVAAFDIGRTVSADYRSAVRGMRAQYFLSFGVIGAVLPFLSVFLHDRGLTRTQIGYVTAAASFGVVLTPVLITLLADAAMAGRVLMAGVFAASGVLLAAVLGVHGF